MRLKSLILLLSLGLSWTASSQVPSLTESEWADLSSAKQIWLIGSKTQKDIAPKKTVIYLYYSSPMENGVLYALREMMLATKNWTFHRSYQYRNGVSFPVGISNLLLSQSPEKWIEDVENPTFFVSKKDDPTERLILTASATSLMVYYAAEEIISERPKDATKLASQFRDEFETYEREESHYKGSVVELKENYVFGYYDTKGLEGIDWKDFIMEPKLKKELMGTVDGFLSQFEFKTWKEYKLPMNRGVLLYGPPGTGKSMIGKILASRIINKKYPAHFSMVFISARHVYGESAIRTLFDVARRLRPAIVFIEDIDLIAGTDRSVNPGVKNELMQQLSGIEKLEGILTIGTTNLGSKLDPALTRSKRLGFHYEVGLPGLDERALLFQLFTKKAKVEDTTDWTSLASLSEGMSGADVREVCQLALSAAIRDQSYTDQSHTRLYLKETHLKAALNEIKSTRASK